LLGLRQSVVLTARKACWTLELDPQLARVCNWSALPLDA
jgi:hypothetical protein